MENHGTYVIAAYVVAATGLISMVLWSMLRLRAGHKRLAREQTRHIDTPNR